MSLTIQALAQLVVSEFCRRFLLLFERLLSGGLFFVGRRLRFDSFVGHRWRKAFLESAGYGLDRVSCGEFLEV